MRALLKSEVEWVSGGLYSNTVEEIIVEAPTNDNDWNDWLDVWTPEYMDDVFSYNNDDLGDGGNYSGTIANMSIQNANHDDLANLYKAVKYLQGVPQAAALIARAEAAGITIQINHNGDDRAVLSTSPPTVHWDPTAAHFMPDNSLQSAAMALIHEISHALDAIQAAPTFDNYHNYEEKRVIEEVETPIAEALGEPTRDDHIDRAWVHLGDSDDHITL